MTFKILIPFLLFFPLGVFAGSISINEVGWMGTIVSPNDEWIELYNNTQSPITLDGWQLTSQDGTPKIILSGIIPVNGFYLLERTNDETVPNVPADKVYTGALGNNGEHLTLYNNLNDVIDEIDCSAGWIGGDNTTKQTMEKISTGWQTSKNPGGTPKMENSTEMTDIGQQPAEIQQSPPEPIVEQTETAPIDNPAETKPSYPNGIVFNEILSSPEGPDETEEWIEIYNQNSFEVDIAGWKVKDNEGKSTTYIFPDEIKIGPNGYLVLTRPQTKITLNNTGDKLMLIRPDGKIIDSMVYGKSPRNQSYNRVNANWLWSSILTPGLVNTVTDGSIKKKSEGKESLVKNEQIVASLSQTIPKPRSFLFIFLIAIGTAVSSVIIFFLFKNKVNNN